MKIIMLIAFIALFMPQWPVSGLSLVGPYSWVKSSKRGLYIFKMMPEISRYDGEKVVVDREAFGIAYKVTEEGDFEEIWRTKGWYAFEGFLSDDGQFFVRFGYWAMDERNHTDLAIAFYKQGKLLKEYQVRELIKEPDFIEYSSGPYGWRSNVQTIPNGFRNQKFHLVMVDKTSYSFDCETGEIVGEGRDEGAKSYLEVEQERKAEAEKRGRELYEGSSVEKEFSPHFDISQMEELTDRTPDPSLKCPLWTAEFTPKAHFDYKVSMKGLLPIKEENRIEVALKPEPVLLAINAAFTHPFIKERFNAGGARRLRLRIREDRLHWNTPELLGFIEKLKSRKSNESDLAHWAYFAIDGKDLDVTAVYMDTQTGEVIAINDRKWPRKVALFDRDGKSVEMAP